MTSWKKARKDQVSVNQSINY